MPLSTKFVQALTDIIVFYAKTYGYVYEVTVIFSCSFYIIFACAYYFILFRKFQNFIGIVFEFYMI